MNDSEKKLNGNLQKNERPRRKCEICGDNKTYNASYYSSHKKSKKHLDKVKAIEVKKELLKEDVKKPERTSETIIGEVIDLMQELKVCVQQSVLDV